MSNEIEKKYLPSDNSRQWMKDVIGSDLILQVYLKDESNTPYRVRLHLDKIAKDGTVLSEENAVKCYKQLTGVVEGVPVYDEKETPINKFEALEIIRQNIESIVIKKRYYVPFHDFTFEIDDYYISEAWSKKSELWPHDGYMQTIEVEFGSAEDIVRYNSIEKPLWLGKEITVEHQYKNSNLAKMEKNEKFEFWVNFTNSIALRPLGNKLKL